MSKRGSASIVAATAPMRDKVTGWLIAAAAFGVVACSPVVHTAESENLATSDSRGVGSVTSGDYTATHTQDEIAQEIAEVKDANNQFRLEWYWHFASVTDGESHQLRLNVQATNAKHGIDHYDFYVASGGDSWTFLGTATQPTMTGYVFDVPAEFAIDGMTIRAIDTNTNDDSRRASQLWVDRLVVVSRNSSTDPGNPGDGGGDSGGGGGGGGDDGGGDGGY